MMEWKPIETAPINTPVKIKLGEGMEIVARLIPDGAMSDLDTYCDQWQAEYEGEHPECWDDGCCWESNAGGMASMQPHMWSEIPV